MTEVLQPRRPVARPRLALDGSPAQLDATRLDECTRLVDGWPRVVAAVGSGHRGPIAADEESNGDERCTSAPHATRIRARVESSEWREELRRGAVLR